MRHQFDVAGIDTGLTLLDRTSGVCRTGVSGEVVDHAYIDRASRRQALGAKATYAVLAIDAPVLPDGNLNYDVRLCEKVFVWGEFQKRCKPGESHVAGTGQALRRAGVETAQAMSEDVSSDKGETSFPRVINDRNIVEAFPNAFLGVCLNDAVFSRTPGRGEKTDWLYEEWLADPSFAKLQTILSWSRPVFWQSVAENTHHDERAALVCALTALCVALGSYVAVGEQRGGYFFLPPRQLWAPWAWRALEANRRDSRLRAQVNVWVDGKPYAPKDPLPNDAG